MHDTEGANHLKLSCSKLLGVYGLRELGSVAGHLGTHKECRVQGVVQFLLGPKPSGLHKHECGRDSQSWYWHWRLLHYFAKTLSALGFMNPNG